MIEILVVKELLVRTYIPIKEVRIFNTILKKIKISLVYET